MQKARPKHLAHKLITSGEAVGLQQQAMLPRKLLVLWLGWIVLSSCCYFLAGQAANHHTGSHQHFGDFFHGFLQKPHVHDKQPVMPNNLHHEQQLMLEALQRQKQQELHLLMQEKKAHNSSNVEVLKKQQEKWPDGYIAICAVVKDQGKDLRYWIEYHR
jgi:hypothetical protein